MMKEYLEITKFLKDNTPLIFDLEKHDLVYDKNSMYYRTIKFIINGHIIGIVKQRIFLMIMKKWMENENE